MPPVTPGALFGRRELLAALLSFEPMTVLARRSRLFERGEERREACGTGSDDRRGNHGAAIGGTPSGHWRATGTVNGECCGVPHSPSAAGGKWQVSTTGGNWPRWRRDGTELFYVAPNDRLTAVTVNGRNAEFEAGAAKPLFVSRPRAQQGLNAQYNYDVSSDGQRFLVNTLVDQAAPAPITLVFNWTAALKQ